MAYTTNITQIRKNKYRKIAIMHAKYKTIRVIRLRILKCRL